MDELLQVLRSYGLSRMCRPPASCDQTANSRFGIDSENASVVSLAVRFREGHSVPAERDVGLILLRSLTSTRIQKADRRCTCATETLCR